MFIKIFFKTVGIVGNNKKMLIKSNLKYFYQNNVPGNCRNRILIHLDWFQVLYL